MNGENQKPQNARVVRQVSHNRALVETDKGVRYTVNTGPDAVKPGERGVLRSFDHGRGFTKG